jgi:hypothetical protein
MDTTTDVTQSGEDETCVTKSDDVGYREGRNAPSE